MTLSNLLRLCCALSACCVIPLYAQVATGTINVTVVDGTGAVVPAARVKINNNNTGLSRAGNTNERGELIFEQRDCGWISVWIRRGTFPEKRVATSSQHSRRQCRHPSRPC